MASDPIAYQTIEPYLIAYLTAHIDSRSEIPPLLDSLQAACGEAACGDGMIVLHGGAVKEGYLVEAALPVSRPVETSGVHSRMLEPVKALVAFHYGKHDTIRETVLKVYDYHDQHAWTTALLRREIYRVLDVDHPENNVTEVQVLLHEWDQLLAGGVEEELGVRAREIVMQGIESITTASSFEDYSAWVRGAIERIDTLTSDEGRKCRAVSRCAHVFPQERIDHLRRIYKNGGIDDVLQEMHTDHFWYEKPLRRENVIYERKNPFDPEGYAKGETPAARRKAYCHCPFVRPYLDEVPSRLSPTFCYCGAGWYRRLWEGILGLPVKIEHHETILRGDDQCTFTITFPLEMTGEYPLSEREEANA